MNPIDQLKSVLCDHEEKCCISGSDEDRAIIDRALRELAEPAVELEPPSDERIFDAWVSASDGNGIAYDGPSFEQGYLLGRVEGDTALSDVEGRRAPSQSHANQ